MSAAARPRSIDDGVDPHLPVRLRVLRTSPARRLYERFGFVMDGETATHVLMIRPGLIAHTP